MTEITPDIIEKVLKNRSYWHQIAAEIISENSQKRSEDIDSAAAPPSASLGRILESRLQPSSTRLRISPQQPGPRLVPMISEIKTIDPEKGVLLSQSQARRLRRQWNQGRLRGQEQAQHVGERGDAAGEEEEEEGGNPMQDHPGKKCSDAHAGMSHDDFLDRQEEEEEEERLSPRIHGRRHFRIPAGRES
jgi:hypothetical protein